MNFWNRVLKITLGLEKKKEIEYVETLKVKPGILNKKNEDINFTYIGNGLSERLEPFGVKGEVKKITEFDIRNKR